MSHDLPEPDRRTGEGIAAEDLDVVLRVMRQLDGLPLDHPDAIAVRMATAEVFKQVKQRRRKEKQQQVRSNDDAVTAATATGAPGRIDDETQGLPLTSNAEGAIAGTLLRARSCYICKDRFTVVDAFYHQLCPPCAAMSHRNRNARTDLTGRRALLTGGRAKIGMHIALRLLRDGAHLTITTRFPNDAVRRYTSMPDSADWLHRLKIVGIDLRDPAQVIALAGSVAAAGPLDVLVNNAAQTVRRSPQAYAPLVAAESAPLPAGPHPEVVTFSRAGDAVSGSLGGSSAVPVQGGPDGAADAADGGANGGAVGDGEPVVAHWAPSPHALTALALTAGSASMDRVADRTAIDAGGLLPDLAHTNSWVQTVEEVSPLEMLEVQLCNSTAPFILVSMLRPALREAAAKAPSGRAYVVNVSAMEGQFTRGYKSPGHPHTNMAKAALNMLTRTSAKEMLETDGILMTAVDTGWITDERPHPTKQRLAEEGFHAPLDLVDGAARVYHPVVAGEAGEDLYGCFLKDYKPSNW
nr:SDR family NAD(P)-dependent oxidoreductase [Kineosporia sp. R_H_3]